MQGRNVQYSSHRLWPHATADDAQLMLCLDGASPALVRWLCAILSPELGWSAGGKGLPPWTASLSRKVQLKILTDALEPTEATRDAPRSTEATKLLLELCYNYGLGSDISQDGKPETLPPYKAAFFAGLVLPFYSFMDIRPQFAYPCLTR